jgi:predicted GIY-YIG superfamily endonuclease
MHYVYAVQNEYGEFLRIGECKDLKRRLYVYKNPPRKNKYGNSLCNGQFHGQNVELIVIKECENKDEAQKWEGIFKQFLGFEWTEQTRSSKGGKVGGKIAGQKNKKSGHIVKISKIGNQRMKELYSKSVLCFKKDTGEFVGEFYSYNEAARRLGLNTGGISQVIRGKIKSTGGYTFRLKE